MLTAEGVRLSFGGSRVLGNEELGLDLHLHLGDFVVLRGGNGSGKTSLLNVLSGHLQPDQGTISLGGQFGTTFKFPQPWWRRGPGTNRFTPERLARLGVGRTWQDSRLFASMSLLDNLAVAAPAQAGESALRALLRPHAVRRADVVNQRSARESLRALGLDDRAGSSADRISLGQGKRVSVLRALRSGSRVLLFDEPLAGLDGPGLREVLGLLRKLAKSGQYAVVVVEHTLNLKYLAPLATDVWALEDGRLTRTSALGLDAVLTGPDLRSRIQRAAPQAIQSIPPQMLPGGAKLTRFQVAATDTRAPAMRVKKLTARRGHREVLSTESDDVSFDLHVGEVTVLEAPNGWGKTTLLESMAGFLPVARGDIQLEDQSIRDMPTWWRARQGLVLMRARGQVFPDLTVTESMSVAGVNDVRGPVRALGRRLVSSLSGGEQQLVAIECALAMEKPRVILLDEPFSALDDARVQALVERLAALAAHCAVLIALPAAHLDYDSNISGEIEA